MAQGATSGAGSPFQWFLATGYSRQPFTSIPAPPFGFQAGADGAVIGRMGWADPSTGIVTNVYSPNTLLGFVMPTFNEWNWQRVYVQRTDAQGNWLPSPYLVLRTGMPCIMAAVGDFVTVFPYGALAGQRVWTNPADGSLLGYDGGGYIETPFVVMQTGSQNARLRMSSFANPTN